MRFSLLQLLHRLLQVVDALAVTAIPVMLLQVIDPAVGHLEVHTGILDHDVKLLGPSAHLDVTVHSLDCELIDLVHRLLRLAIHVHLLSIGVKL